MGWQFWVLISFIFIAMLVSYFAIIWAIVGGATDAIISINNDGKNAPDNLPHA